MNKNWEWEAKAYALDGGSVVYPEERMDTVRGFPGSSWESYGFFFWQWANELTPCYRCLS
ncbi:MAG: hypothetical protein PHY31_10225 [Smithellaceae bacterium]|nr:hypothetical protein [Smithellaceae bacterium]